MWSFEKEVVVEVMVGVMRGVFVVVKVVFVMIWGDYSEVVKDFLCE